MGLRSTTNLSAKLARWSLFIADYNFVLVHKAGRAHTNADGLTRSRTSQSAEDPEVGISVDAFEELADRVLTVLDLEENIPSKNDSTTSSYSSDFEDQQLSLDAAAQRHCMALQELVAEGPCE